MVLGMNMLNTINVFNVQTHIFLKTPQIHKLKKLHFKLASGPKSIWSSDPAQPQINPNLQFINQTSNLPRHNQNYIYNNNSNRQAKSQKNKVK